MKHETTQVSQIRTDLAHQHYALSDGGHSDPVGCYLCLLPMHPQLSSRLVYLLGHLAEHSRLPRSPTVEVGVV